MTMIKAKIENCTETMNSRVFTFSDKVKGNSLRDAECDGVLYGKICV